MVSQWCYFYEFSRVTAIVVLTALFLDFLLGEPRRGHPLVAFGRAATFTENRFQQFSRQGRVLKWLGLFACCLLIAIPVVLLWLLLAHLSAWVQSSWVQSPWSQWLVETAVLYFVVGLRSLREHAMAVVEQLQAGDLSVAREEVSRIVSRDTSNLTEQGVATATVESVLENGSDGVLAPIFWYLVLGAPGALLYRLVNTLDAMWGYRNQRYLHFGWAAAKLDDAMNWIPARLTAMSYALMGDFPQAIQCMKTQGAQTDSPNAGRVMAAGAGALGVSVGGPTTHKGKETWRPIMGTGMGAGPGVVAVDIYRALNLLNRVVVLWLLLLGAGTVIAVVAA